MKKSVRIDVVDGATTPSKTTAAEVVTNNVLHKAGEPSGTTEIRTEQRGHQGAGAATTAAEVAPTTMSQNVGATPYRRPMPLPVEDD